MRSPYSGFALLHALAGLGVWALCFVVLYGGLSVACRSAYAHTMVGSINVVSVMLGLAWAAHAVVLGTMLLGAWRKVRNPLSPDRSGEPGDAFVRWLTLVLHGMSMIALVALAAPLLVLAPCA